MNKLEYFNEKIFDRENFSETCLVQGEYEKCKFINCNFSNLNLSKFRFVDCDFFDCNLAMIKSIDTTLQNIRFKSCKILGVQFENCYQLIISFSFDNCVLNHSSFYQMKIKKTLFINCEMKEVDFTETDISESIFDNCNLYHAIFNYTNIEKTDFRSSFNYSIDPEQNRIYKAKFSLVGITGLLNKYNIEIE